MKLFKGLKTGALSAMALAAFSLCAEDSIVREQLRPYWQKAGITEVMVLGTAHLSAFEEQYKPETMQPVLAALQRFAPDRIAVEVLPPSAIRQLRQDKSPAAAQLLDMFASGIVERADVMRQHLDKSKALAEAPLQRLYQLIADYQWHSAVLHWQTLDSASKQKAELPESILAALEKGQHAINEIHQIAMPLAQRLGVMQLDPVDDHSDGLSVMSWPEENMKSVFFHPLKKALATDPVLQAGNPKFIEALTSGSLLSYYSWANGKRSQQDDVRIQWSAYLHMDDTEDYGPSRAALWETRNSAIATNISRITAQPGVKRVLVIYGSAHKPFLDAYLGAFAHIRLRQFDEFLLKEQNAAVIQ